MGTPLERRGGRGCGGTMIPAKMTSKPPDLQNYLQAPQNSQPPWRHQVSTPRILVSACCFYFLLKGGGLSHWVRCTRNLAAFFIILLFFIILFMLIYDHICECGLRRNFQWVSIYNSKNPKNVKNVKNVKTVPDK